MTSGAGHTARRVLARAVAILAEKEETERPMLARALRILLATGGAEKRRSSFNEEADSSEL